MTLEISKHAIKVGNYRAIILYTNRLMKENTDSMWDLETIGIYYMIRLNFQIVEKDKLVNGC